jgi:hypothetical protein
MHPKGVHLIHRLPSSSTLWNLYLIFTCTSGNGKKLAGAGSSE